MGLRPAASAGSVSNAGIARRNACRAPRYVGFSTKTRLPSSRKTRAARSRACCEPETICTSSGFVGTPCAVSRAAMNSLRRGSPSVKEYCNACAAFSASTLCAASSSSFTGNPRGVGRPPAKEMTSGRLASFRSSRMRLALAPAFL